LVSANIGGTPSPSTISAISYSAKTKIGRNGFYSFWDSDNYLYYSNTYGYETRVGSYGQQITEAGIKSWNGSAWASELNLKNLPIVDDLPNVGEYRLLYVHPTTGAIARGKNPPS